MFRKPYKIRFTDPGTKKTILVGYPSARAALVAKNANDADKGAKTEAAYLGRK